MRPTPRFATSLAAIALCLVPVQHAFAWGHDGHSLINRTAVAALPADVPAFLKTPAALDAVAFYAPEPDHWRQKNTEPTLYAAISPDHFIDLEWGDLIAEAPQGPRSTYAGAYPRDRWGFIFGLNAVLLKHPEVKGNAVDTGLLPYAAVEDYERLKNTFRTYRMLLATKQDTKAIEAEIIFEIGIFGHFVADGSQPLHTTIQYNGWTGPNPNGYTTDHVIHQAWEGDFVHNNLAKIEIAALVATKAVPVDDVFADFMAYLHHTNGQVEKVYQLYKTNAFADAGTPEGYTFTNQQLANGATKLRDLIYTAWLRSGDPAKVYVGN